MRKYKPSPVLKGIIVSFIVIIGVMIFATKILPKADNGDQASSPEVIDSQGSSQSTITESTGAGQGSSTQTPTANKNSKKQPDMIITCDSFIGYINLIEANGGLRTTPGSIMDQVGIDLEIQIVDNPDDYIRLLLSGKVNAVGCTSNRVAFLSTELDGIQWLVTTSHSFGADGIISKDTIKSVSDFVGKQIAVPQDGESEELLAYLVLNDDTLSDSQKKEIIANRIQLADASECGTVYFSNKVDIAATWEPHLTTASQRPGSHILFDTSSAPDFILSGFAGMSDWAEANAETVSKFIDGFFRSLDHEFTNYDVARSVVPLFSDMSDEEIREQLTEVLFCDYAENMSLYSGTIRTMHGVHCDTWAALGVHVDKSSASKIYTNKYVKMLADKYKTTMTEVSAVEKATEIVVTEEQSAKAANVDTVSFMQKNAVIEFQPDSAVFLDPDEAYAQMDEFVTAALAMRGTIISVAGNANVNPENQSEFSFTLSRSRAQAVADYLIQNGIDASRIVVTGNAGNDLRVPVGSPNDYLNRRTDVKFMTIEGLSQ